MHVDFFDFFRWVLGTVVTIYATVVTAQSLYGWYVYLGGQERYVSLMRRYIMLQGLRLRIKTFGGDTLICILLTVVWILLIRRTNWWRGSTPILIPMGQELSQPDNSAGAGREIVLSAPREAVAAQAIAGQAIAGQAPSRQLAELPKDELAHLAESLGLDSTRFKTQQDLVAGVHGRRQLIAAMDRQAMLDVVRWGAGP